MPIVEIKFNIPEEAEAMVIALNANKYRTSLQEMDIFLRNKIKYHDKTETTFEEIRQKLFEIAKDNDLNIWSGETMAIDQFI